MQERCLPVVSLSVVSPAYRCELQAQNSGRTLSEEFTSMDEQLNQLPNIHANPKLAVACSFSYVSDGNAPELLKNCLARLGDWINDVVSTLCHRTARFTVDWRLQHSAKLRPFFSFCLSGNRFTYHPGQCWSNISRFMFLAFASVAWTVVIWFYFHSGESQDQIIWKTLLNDEEFQAGYNVRPGKMVGA
jgi:hypothetical protein